MNQTTLTFEPDEKIGYRLLAEQWFDLPLTEVFSFFANAMELERITPGFLKFRVLTPEPIDIQKGTLLDYRLKLHGIPIKWRTEICDWQPPFRFVDRQLRGPYQLWYHEHTFEEIDGRTRALDNVHYIPRGGALVHKYFVRPDLEKIFRFRQDSLQQIFDEKKQQRSASAHGVISHSGDSANSALQQATVV